MASTDDRATPMDDTLEDDLEVPGDDAVKGGYEKPTPTKKDPGWKG